MSFYKIEQFEWCVPVPSHIRWLARVQAVMLRNDVKWETMQWKYDCIDVTCYLGSRLRSEYCITLFEYYSLDLGQERTRRKSKKLFCIGNTKTLSIKFMDATNGRRKYCFRFCQCISVSTVTRTLVGRTDFSPRAEAGNFISRVEQLDFWRQGRILKMAAPKSKYECKNKENIFNLRFLA